MVTDLFVRDPDWKQCHHICDEILLNNQNKKSLICETTQLHLKIMMMNEKRQIKGVLV